MIYLFGGEVFIHPQFFIGFTVGALALGTWFFIKKPLAGNWSRRTIRVLQQANKQLTNAILCSTDESITLQNNYKQMKNELTQTNGLLKKKDREIEELEDTLVHLSKEKNDFQGKYQKLYIENDRLKAKLTRLTSPAYIDRRGKIKKAV